MGVNIVRDKLEGNIPAAIAAPQYTTSAAFLVAVPNLSTRSNFKDRQVDLGHHLSVLSWHQEHEAAGHIVSTVRQQRDDCAWLHSPFCAVQELSPSMAPPTLRVGLPTQLMRSGNPLSDTPNGVFPW